MTSKKYLVLICAMLLSVSAAFAQTSSSGYSVWDSSVITSKRMPQQNEFWNNAYNFPAKPRSMWEIGVSGGLFGISGDVSSLLPTFGFGVHARKAFGYVFSLRAQYLYGTAKGLNWQATEFYDRNNNAWHNAGYTNQLIYHNYKNKTQDLSLQGIVTLNNILFHKQQTNVIMYVGAGFGATAYQTKINALDENGDPYTSLFANVYSGSTDPNSNLEFLYKNRKDIRKALKDGLDGTYETNAETLGERTASLGDNTLRFSTSVLAGVAYRLGKRLNLAIEDRHTFVKDDLMDGVNRQDNPAQPLTSNWDSYNYLSVGINYNLGKNSVEPLWWINPLDYAYSELNNPKHMKLPKPTYEDADGDGVVDQLDREPNTPAGCGVDTHGVSADTDGDGVPDCKDKQLITPTECQPVNADGVGTCPEPECCKNIKNMPPVATCPCDYPSITFAGSGSTVNDMAKGMLSTVASKMKANPTCNITVTGYPEASKASQASCQKRVDAVKNYLVEKTGISADRIATNCEIDGGDKNTVDIKCQ